MFSSPCVPCSSLRHAAGGHCGQITDVNSSDDFYFKNKKACPSTGSGSSNLEPTTDKGQLTTDYAAGFGGSITAPHALHVRRSSEA